jgi:tellurite resistance protein TerC
LWWYLNGAFGPEIAQRKTLEFLTGYLIEQSLSIDNMFVFVMIFGYFAVPPELQRRVLLYGVLGAIVMRAAMIFAGVWLVTQFEWLLYAFGVFLIITGIKMLLFAEQQPDLDNNRFIGGKMVLMPWIHMPVEWSLAVVGAVILGSVLLSLIMSKNKVESTQ